VLCAIGIVAATASLGSARSSSSVNLLSPPDRIKIKVPSALDERFYRSKVHFAWHIDGCQVVDGSAVVFGPTDSGPQYQSEGPVDSPDGYVDIAVGTLDFTNTEWHVMYSCRESPRPLDSQSRTIDVGKAKPRGKGCGIAKVTFLSGDVTIDGASAFKGELIDSQAYVITGRGRLEFRSQDGSLYRIGGNSRLDLANLPCRSAEDRKVTAKLIVGDIWAKVAKLLGGDEKFKVATENAWVGVRGTTLEVTVNGAQTQARVHTIVGVVSANGAGKAVLVKKGQCATITKAGPNRPFRC